MAKKKLLASIALTAGLLGGGAAGFVLGVPGVSGAQTTTTAPDQPSTSVPNDGSTAPDRPPRADGRNCPDKGGTAPDGSQPAPSGSSNSNTGFHRGAGRRV